MQNDLLNLLRTFVTRLTACNERYRRALNDLTRGLDALARPQRRRRRGRRFVDTRFADKTENP
jgi:hypothetical protein